MKVTDAASGIHTPYNPLSQIRLGDKRIWPIRRASTTAGAAAMSMPLITNQGSFSPFSEIICRFLIHSPDQFAGIEETARPNPARRLSAIANRRHRFARQASAVEASTQNPAIAQAIIFHIRGLGPYRNSASRWRTPILAIRRQSWISVTAAPKENQAPIGQRARRPIRVVENKRSDSAQNAGRTWQRSVAADAPMSTASANSYGPSAGHPRSVSSQDSTEKNKAASSATVQRNSETRP